MRKLLALPALLLGGGVAQADNGLVYLGAGVSWDNLKDISIRNTNGANIVSLSVFLNLF